MGVKRLARAFGEAVAGGSPGLSRPLQKLVFRRHPLTLTTVRYACRGLGTRSTIHPFEIYRVDPQAIHRYVPWGTFGTFTNAGTSQDGQWDIQVWPLDSVGKHSVVTSYLNGEIERKELTYEYLRRHGYSEQEATFYANRGYGQYLDALANTIEHEGFELEPRDSLESTISKYDQVAIDIARDGELIFDSNGWHRLIIAQMLELEYIPVRINGIHTKWLDRNELPREHPQLSHLTRIPISFRDIATLEPHPSTSSPAFSAEQGGDGE